MINIEEITSNHKEAVRFFNALAEAIPDPADQRGWAIITASSLSEEAKLLFAVLGEVAKMVRHPVLGHLVMPPRKVI